MEPRACTFDLGDSVRVHGDGSTGVVVDFNLSTHPGLQNEVLVKLDPGFSRMVMNKQRDLVWFYEGAITAITHAERRLP
jgi:hypothetical protein